MQSAFLKLSLVLLLLLPLQSCEQLLLETDLNNSPRANFEYLWQECKEKYSFFEYKGIDWDAIYDKYSPLINDDMSQIELFNTLFVMLNELRDGHVNLISPFNVSRFEVDLLGQENFDFRLIRENYLEEDYYITGPLIHNFLADGKLGYVRYESFQSTVTELDLEIVLLRYQETQGLIIDLRQNGGGSLSNVFRILNRFAKERTLIYNSYIKSGPGPDDFDGPQPAYLEPKEELTSYDKQVIVLIDRGTYSAASFFSLSTLALPNFRLMGDYTGGGLGIPNGGQLPNGWTYRFSISQTLTPDGKNYENGVPPHERVLLRKIDTDSGKDTVLETAIKQLL